MSLIKSTGRGASWQVLGGVLQTIIRISATMVLARKLTPEDFGIFLVATLVYGMFQLLSASGMTAGIMVKDQPDKEDLSTCYWLTLIIRLVLSVISLLTAPLVAIILDMPEAESSIQVISVLILISGIGALPQTLLAKKLNFKKISLIKLLGTVLESGIAVALVLHTSLGLWCLIIAMIVGHTFISFCFLFASNWLPSLIFAKDRTQYLLRYGLNSLGATTATYIANNVDNFVVAKMLGVKALGFYDFAYRVPHILNERITGPIGGVAFSVLANIKSSNNAELGNAYIKFVKYVAWISFPAYAGLAVLAPDVILFLWGEQWLAITQPMQILCITAAIQSFSPITTYFYYCHDRPDLPLKFDMLGLVLVAILAPALGYFYNITGVAYGMLITKLALMISPLYAISRYGGNITYFLKEIGKPLSTTILMFGLVYLVKLTVAPYVEQGILMILLISSIGALIYIAIVYILYRRELIDILSTIKQTIK